MRKLILAAVLLGATAVPTFAAVGAGMFFAVVTASGNVAYSLGVAEVNRIQTGVFAVTFTRKINTCSSVATITGSTAGYATATASKELLTVRTFNMSGTAANLPFNVTVLCGAAPGA